MKRFGCMARQAGGSAFVVLFGMQLGACGGTLDLPAGHDAYAVMAPSANAVSPVYLIGPGDVISVMVFGQPDMSLSTVIVDPQGQVSMPLIGMVRVGGRTAGDVKATIESQLRPRFLIDPHVAVNVTEYASKLVTVDGQVARPGVLPISGPTTLESVIARSGGGTNLAKLSEVVVFRRRGEERLAAKFDLKAIRRGEMEDPVILEGDTIIVGFDRVEGAYRDALAALPLFAVFRAF